MKQNFGQSWCSFGTGSLGSRTGPHADRPADKGSFAEANMAVVDREVPHAACVGPPSGDAPWEKRF